MRKLIKKGQDGLSLLSNSIMKNAGINFSKSKPIPKISDYKNISPILSDKGFQSRMAKGQSDYMKGIKWGKFKEGIGDIGKDISNFSKTEIGKETITGLGNTLDTTSNFVGGGEKSGLTQGLSTLGDLAMKIDPITGLLIKGASFANQATSIKDITKINAGLGYSGSNVNEEHSTDGINRLLGNRSKYLAGLSGKKSMATNAKMNSDKQIKQLSAINIGNQSSQNNDILNYNPNKFNSILAGKKGMALQDIRNYIKVRHIEKEPLQNSNLYDNLEKSEIQIFQNGGSLIPSGALHKNKHNLESINSDLKEVITKKGIPVISYALEGDILEYENDGKTPKVLAKGGEVIQHAEIEKDEVILNISLTKKLVELMKKDTSESMIEAGKILARELMENTTDNTGLTDKILGNEN